MPGRDTDLRAGSKRNILVWNLYLPAALKYQQVAAKDRSHGNSRSGAWSLSRVSVVLRPREKQIQSKPMNVRGSDGGPRVQCPNAVLRCLLFLVNDGRSLTMRIW